MRTVTRVLRPLLCVLFLALVLSGCMDEDTKVRAQFPDVYGKDDTWLISWYICGSDLESEYGAASADLEELMETDLPPNVRVLILAGGTQTWQNDTFTRPLNLYLYDADGLHELENLPDADMGSTGTLTNFLRYGAENYPADHRVFVFWDHGGGSAAGVCADERTENMLRLNDIRQAFSDVYGEHPNAPPYELVGFVCRLAGRSGGIARVNQGDVRARPGSGVVRLRNLASRSGRLFFANCSSVSWTVVGSSNWFSAVTGSWGVGPSRFSGSSGVRLSSRLRPSASMS